METLPYQCFGASRLRDRWSAMVVTTTTFSASDDDYAAEVYTLLPPPQSRVAARLLRVPMRAFHGAQAITAKAYLRQQALAQACIDLDLHHHRYTAITAPAAAIGSALTPIGTEALAAWPETGDVSPLWRIRDRTACPQLRRALEALLAPTDPLTAPVAVLRAVSEGSGQTAVARWR